MYIDKLDDTVNKYNNTYHRTIKMKSVDVKPSMYINIDKENKECPKFQVVIYILINQKIFRTFFEKKLQKKKRKKEKELRVEKLIKRKGDKLYVKWKGYDSSEE